MILTGAKLLLFLFPRGASAPARLSHGRSAKVWLKERQRVQPSATRAWTWGQWLKIKPPVPYILVHVSHLPGFHFGSPFLTQCHVPVLVSGLGPLEFVAAWQTTTRRTRRSQLVRKTTKRRRKKTTARCTGNFSLLLGVVPPGKTACGK